MDKNQLDKLKKASLSYDMSLLNHIACQTCGKREYQFEYEENLYCLKCSAELLAKKFNVNINYVEKRLFQEMNPHHIQNSIHN
jgi:hypothetical protein